MVDALRRNRSLVITLGVIGVLLVLMAGQYEPRVTASIILSGLTLGALYFLVTSGLSLIFGLMDVLNFAHGLFFMAGAYIGYTLYANPRMLLNTLPFALALFGGLLIGGVLAGSWRERLQARGWDRAAAMILWGAAVVLVVIALAGFDLLVLAANSATSAGGAVPTAVAQEPDGRFALRVGLLLVAGLAMGAALTVRQIAGVRDAGVPWRGLVGGLILLGIGVALIFLRTPGETLLLELSSDLRFVLALVVGAGGGALAGGLVEWGMIRPLYARPIYQVLLTLGLVLVGTELIKGVWGPAGSIWKSPPSSTPAAGSARRPTSWPGSAAIAVQLTFWAGPSRATGCSSSPSAWSCSS
jgi:branched-chain amino acid transport system permease protein